MNTFKLIKPFIPIWRCGLNYGQCSGLQVEWSYLRPGWVKVLCSWAKHFTLHPGVQMDKTNCQGSVMTPPGWWTSISSSRGGVVILLVTSCLGNLDKLWLGGSLGSGTDFILLPLKGFSPQIIIIKIISNDMGRVGKSQTAWLWLFNFKL